MNIDFSVFNNSKFKLLRFVVNNTFPDGSTFNDEFYGKIKEIGGDYLIVEQDYIESDADFNIALKTQQRKLLKAHFIVDTKVTPLNS